jgi:hypothetical protein
MVSKLGDDSAASASSADCARPVDGDMTKRAINSNQPIRIITVP